MAATCQPNRGSFALYALGYTVESCPQKRRNITHMRVNVLKQAENAERPDHREKLIELSKVWMKAAMNEARHHLNGIAGTSVSVRDFAE
jgi:hypothetical protein